MTAFHNMILLSWGAPLIPAGGSCCKRLKSRISLFLDGVDMAGYVSNRRRLTSSPPSYTDFCPFQSYILSFCAPVFLLLASASCSWVISLSIYLFLLPSSHTNPFACLPRTLSTLILAWEDEAQRAVVRQAKARKQEWQRCWNPCCVGEPASQPAREKDRTDRCRPSAAAARQFLPTAGLLIKGLGTRIGPSLRSLNLRRGKQRMNKTQHLGRFCLNQIKRIFSKDYTKGLQGITGKNK